jgi:UDP-2,3-diacylglucosamine pyrophosphatase LpxH
MKPKQNIIFISDLHLGSGAANDFHKTYQLYKLFDYAEENATELVILGDFMELLQCDFMEIYIQHHPIFTRLFALARKIPVKYIIGNHDSLVAIEYSPDGKSRFLGSEIEILPEYENLDLKVLAAHGHQYSLMNSRDDILDAKEESNSGDKVARIVGWLEKFVSGKIDNVLERLYLDYKKLLRKVSGETINFAKLVTPANPDYLKLGGNYLEYEAGAADLLCSERYDLVIFGHTHIPGIAYLKDGIYVNSGSWVGDDFLNNPPLFVELNEVSVKLVDAETYAIFESANLRKAKPLSLPRIQKKQKTKV